MGWNKVIRLEIRYISDSVVNCSRKRLAIRIPHRVPNFNLPIHLHPTPLYTLLEHLYPIQSLITT